MYYQACVNTDTVKGNQLQITHTIKSSILFICKTD